MTDEIICLSDFTTGKSDLPPDLWHKKQPVYDLSVFGEHEKFLRHYVRINCMDPALAGTNFISLHTYFNQQKYKIESSQDLSAGMFFIADIEKLNEFYHYDFFEEIIETTDPEFERCLYFFNDKGLSQFYDGYIGQNSGNYLFAHNCHHDFDYPVKQGVRPRKHSEPFFTALNHALSPGLGNYITFYHPKQKRLHDLFFKSVHAHILASGDLLKKLLRTIKYPTEFGRVMYVYNRTTKTRWYDQSFVRDFKFNEKQYLKEHVKNIKRGVFEEPKPIKFPFEFQKEMHQWKRHKRWEVYQYTGGVLLSCFTAHAYHIPRLSLALASMRSDFNETIEERDFRNAVKLWKDYYYPTQCRLIYDHRKTFGLTLEEMQGFEGL